MTLQRRRIPLGDKRLRDLIRIPRISSKSSKVGNTHPQHGKALNDHTWTRIRRQQTPAVSDD
jgi:hypothetical protein